MPRTSASHSCDSLSALCFLLLQDLRLCRWRTAPIFWHSLLGDWRQGLSSTAFCHYIRLVSHWCSFHDKLLRHQLVPTNNGVDSIENGLLPFCRFALWVTSQFLPVFCFTSLARLVVNGIGVLFVNFMHVRPTLVRSILLCEVDPCCLKLPLHFNKYAYSLNRLPPFIILLQPIQQRHLPFKWRDFTVFRFRHAATPNTKQRHALQ